MIHVDPSLFLKRLVIVSYSGGIAYDQEFHKGVNIIRGHNSSGKSTIANFIFFALGGDFNNWTTQALKCRELYAEVELNATVATLRRTITTSSQQPMSIFWGRYEDAVKDQINWQTYPYRQSDNRISFSKALFNALDFPEVRTDDESNITMHQILRLLYIDQDTPTQSLFRAERFDPPLTRQTIAEILLGIYDDSLYSDRIALRQQEKLYVEKRGQYEGMKKVFSQAGELNLNSLLKSLEDVKSEIIKIDDELIRVKAQQQVNAPRKGALQIQNIQDKLFSVKSQITNESETLQELEVDIFDSIQFISTLERRIKELDYSLITRKYLGELTITHCPNCLNELKSETPEGHCFLCKQPLVQEAERSNAKKLKQELELQVLESRSLLVDKNDTVNRIRSTLPGLVESARLLQRDLDLQMKRSQSTRDERLDRLLIDRGRYEQQIEYLNDRIRGYNILSNLRDELAQIGASVDKLKLQIQEKQERQSVRLQSAITAIKRLTIGLLRTDLPRQDEFKTGSSVELHFSHDAYSLDGGNNFAASSKVYFKNAILYSLFFASLELDFMRYPRFILCDNMEDKGMEKERSQNFQKAIVNKSRSHQTEHQIIFTTSMIAEELEGEELCIGPFYTSTNKTLKI